MNNAPIDFVDDHERTRARLADGTLIKILRADPPPGVRLRTDEELEATLAEALQSHQSSQDIHVFGYGSLMWNPALDVIDACVAHVQGWHRRFCFRMLLGRGTPPLSGAMLALDRGGACKGMLYRIAAEKAQAELRLLWRREMTSGSYNARWITTTVAGQRGRALTFVARRDLDRYIGRAPIEYVAELIRLRRAVARADAECPAR
jgi:cation transport protein ChaC